MGRGFELLCIVLLGLGQMAIMTGYDTQSFVQESVLHSKNEREPLTIDKYAGYYGQAVCSFFYMLTCLISPFVMSIVGPKWTVFAGSVCFSLFQMGFFFINNIYYYFSAGAMGVGFALFYTGCGGYMTSHSTRRTLEQNSAIQWAISCSCMLVGSVILSVVFTVHKDDQLVVGSANGTGGIKESPQHRNFSDEEILYMYGAFFALTVAANVIFVFLPSREIEGCIERRREKRTTLKQHIALVWSTFSNRQMLFLMPSFIHLGLWTLFWVCVYPTTLVFSQSLSRNIYLPALYSLFVGVGEVVMGCTITFMSHRIKNFGLKPTMWIGFVTTTILLACIGTSVPEWSTIMPTSGGSLLIQPTPWLCCLIAFLIGVADSCVNTIRTVICALALPKQRAHAFAASKFYQALGGCVLMYLSPFLSVYHYCCLLVCSLALSLTLFLRVVNDVTRREAEEKQKPKIELETE